MRFEDTVYCRHLSALLVGVVLLSMGCDGRPAEPAIDSTETRGEALVDGTLVAGRPVNFLAAPAGAQLLYTLDVPADQNVVTFTTTGGSGNADMFVYFGATPTPANAQCASAQAGSAETCTVSGRSAAGTWYVLLTATSSCTNVTLTGTYSATGTGSTTVQPLTSGQPVSSLSGAVGEWRTFSLVVPTGQVGLLVGLSEGTGDADLYLRYGSAPTLTAYDCRSLNVGNGESCSVTAPQPGTWYVMLRGTAAYSGAKLLATAVAPPSTLVNGQPVPNLWGAKDALLYFTVDVPRNHSLLKVTLSGGTGDADLYVKAGVAPTTSSYDCRGVLGGTSESCTIASPTPGTYHIMVRAYAAFSGVTLLATFVNNEDLPGTPLVNGVPVTGLSTANSASLLFRLEVPANTGKLTVRVPSLGSGSADMYVKRGSPPGTGESDCSVYDVPDYCSFNEPLPGTWYVLLTPGRGLSYFSSLTLVATYEGTVQTTVLQSGQPVSGVSGAGYDVRYYTLQVPAGQTRLAFWAEGGTGSPHVYARFGSKPTSSSYACSKPLPGACVIESPQAGTWYFRVESLLGSPFAGFTVTAASTSAAPYAAVALVHGTPRQVPAGDPLDIWMYKLEVPANQVRLEFKLQGGTGDISMLAQRGSAPSPTNTAFCGSGSQSCVIERPAAGTWYLRVRGSTSFLGAVLTGTYTPATPLENATLVYGIPVSPASNYYRFEVPPGRTGLSFVTEGYAEANANLYVKRGALPTTTDYDCASANAGTSYERCDFFDPQEGTWFVLAQASPMTSNSSTNATLLALHSETGPVAPIADNVPVPVSGERESFQTYQFEVPEGQGSLLAEVLPSGKYSSSAAELWIQHQSLPTYFWSKCRAFRACDIPTPAAGTWYITVRGYGAFDGALRVTTQARHLRSLTSGMLENPVNAASMTMTYFTLEVPAGATDLHFNLTGEVKDSGNADLYVRYGSAPSEYQYACASTSASGIEENCDIVQPQAGTWYVGVLSRATGSQARLSGTYFMSPGEGVAELSPYVAVSGLSGAQGSERLWKLEVPSGQRMLWFTTGDGLGGGLLRVKRGGRPVGDATLDCSGSSIEGGRQCLILDPAPGTWFVSLEGSSSYRFVSLVGAYFDASTVTPLAQAVPVLDLVVRPSMAQYFKLEVPAGQSTLGFDVSSRVTTLGDLQVFIARDALPTSASTRCEEPSAGLIRCRVPAPEAGTWYVMVKAGTSQSAYNGVSLVGLYGSQVDDAPTVLNGKVVRGISVSPTNARTFKVLVPPGANHLQVEANSEGNLYGPVNLAVRKDGPATATEYDCRTTDARTSQSCWVSNPSPGLWYVTMTSAASYGSKFLILDAR